MSPDIKKLVTKFKGKTVRYTVYIEDDKGRKYYLGHDREHAGYYFNKHETTVRELVDLDVIKDAYLKSSDGTFSDHQHYGQVPKKIEIDDTTVQVIQFYELQHKKSLNQAIDDQALESALGKLTPLEKKALKDHLSSGGLL